MMLLGFIEQGNLTRAGATGKAGYNYNIAWCRQGCASNAVIISAKASGLWRCPSDTGPTDLLPALAGGEGKSNGGFPCNYAFSHGVNDATACFQEAGNTLGMGSAVPIPATERGAFGVNINTRARDITDGLSQTFAMGEGASGSYTRLPKWTVCDGRFCTANDLVTATEVSSGWASNRACRPVFPFQLAGGLISRPPPPTPSTVARIGREFVAAGSWPAPWSRSTRTRSRDPTPCTGRETVAASRAQARGR